MKSNESAEYNRTAEGYMRKAEEKIRGGVLKNLFSSKDERLDSGLDYYKKALDNFKLAKNCSLTRGRMRHSEPRMCKACPRNEERSGRRNLL